MSDQLKVGSTGQITDNLPFGEADASNVNLAQLKETYVAFKKGPNNLTESIDPSVRVIFGKKGSGKTLYLRAIVDYLNNQILNNESNYVTTIDNQPPSTHLVTKISSWVYDERTKGEETWREIWKAVIIKTTLSHILYSRTLKSSTSQKEKERLIETYKTILPKIQAPTSLFSQLQSTLSSFNSQKDIEKYLSSELWGPLEYELADLVKRTPPIYFFLDQVDDDFTHSPHAWLQCQYGLFETIFRLIRNGTYGRRLHITACLREFVYAYVLNNPHGSKYLSETKIVVLKWNQNGAKYFLKKKIEHIDSDFFYQKPKENKNLRDFFGMENVQTIRDNAEHNEDLDQYIVRHTMLMPRDIINIGNQFYRTVMSITNGRSNLEILKQAVRFTAKQIAIEQLRIASLMMSTKWIYNGAYEDDVASFFFDDNFVEGVQRKLEELILSIKKDRFSNKTLVRRINDKHKFGFDQKDKPFNSLFVAGLLGYVRNDDTGNKSEIFFSESRESQFQLPMYQKEYVFHSSLIDHLSIKPSKKPVYAQY